MEGSRGEDSDHDEMTSKSLDNKSKKKVAVFWGGGGAADAGLYGQGFFSN